MCKATLPSRHISYHVSILYQAKTAVKNKQLPNTEALSGQRPHAVPAPEKQYSSGMAKDQSHLGDAR
jgi:hypothetical protein